MYIIYNTWLELYNAGIRHVSFYTFYRLTNNKEIKFLSISLSI